MVSAPNGARPVAKAGPIGASFYGRLAPYGNWIWLQGQYVWVPKNVGPYWRPYTVGRWVFTDRYGWMWVSDEPFGWATYHYGRWGFSNRVGWFWVPGSRWAPAWVAWRSSNDYLAWAPLPPTPDEGLSININVGTVPDYYWQVVPNRDFLAPDLQRRIVRDRDRYRPILRDTQSIGNVTVVNNTVVNNVVNVTYVEEKTKKKVVVHKVERTKDEDKAKGGKIKGEAVEIFQPAPEAKPEAVVPAATKPIEEVAAESKTKATRRRRSRHRRTARSAGDQEASGGRGKASSPSAATASLRGCGAGANDGGGRSASASTSAGRRSGSAATTGRGSGSTRAGDFRGSSASAPAAGRGNRPTGDAGLHRRHRRQRRWPRHRHPPGGNSPPPPPPDRPPSSRRQRRRSAAASRGGRPAAATTCGRGTSAATSAGRGGGPATATSRGRATSAPRGGSGSATPIASARGGDRAEGEEAG